MERLKIGFDSERMKSAQSGLGKFCEHLGGALSQRAGLEMTFFQKKSTHKPFSGNVSYSSISDWNKFLGVPVGDIDIWHCTHQGTAYLPANHKVPVLLTIHDLNFLQIESSSFKIKRKLAHVQRLINRSAAVAFISRHTELEVRRYLQIESKLTQVIYNAPALDLASVRDENRGGIEGPYFFSVGLVTEKKNFHVLLPLLTHFTTYKWVIAGNNDDAYSDKIRSEALRLGISDRVLLLGEISEAEKIHHFRRSEAFLMPSKAEGFCLPVAEAMYFGKPVFLSTSGALPEVGGKLAHYYPSGFAPDEIIAVTQNGLAGFSVEKSELSKTYSRSFSWEAAAEAYEKIYRELALRRAQ